MREIKFRAWDTKVKQPMWDHEGTLSLIMLQGRYLNGTSGDEAKEHLDRFMIMQYTGIKDKNGKEIYESDIVRCWDWGVEPNDLLCISQVEWSSDYIGWWLNPDPTDGDRYDLFRNIEIIGNVYENPELLETP